MPLPGFNAELIDRAGIPEDLWESPERPLGSARFSLQVYDRRFTLSGLPGDVLPHLDRLRMGPSDIPCREEIDILAAESPHPQFNSPALSGLEYVVRFRMEEDRIEMHGYYFAARFRPSDRSIRLYMAHADPAMLATEVENFLRIATSLLLQYEGVILFHSSAVSLGDKTWVFFGPHAAGKSTIALLAPEDALVLGDDLNALAVREDRVYVASVPFPSEVTAVRPIVEREAAALLRLQKADGYSFERLTPARRFAALFGSMPVLNSLPGCVSALQPVIERIVSLVPVCGLDFRKEPEVYEWLEQNLPSIPR